MRRLREEVQVPSDLVQVDRAVLALPAVVELEALDELSELFLDGGSGIHLTELDTDILKPRLKAHVLLPCELGAVFEKGLTHPAPETTQARVWG